MDKKLFIEQEKYSKSYKALQKVEDDIMYVVNAYNRNNKSQLQLVSNIKDGNPYKLVVKIYKICS